MSQTAERFVALDLHKNYLVVGAVDQHHQVILPPHRISNDRFEQWASRHLQPSDAVVMEATANAWYIHDLLEPLVGRVVVAHPYHVKLITASFIKTDKRDTLALARLLAAGLIPTVWVPPRHVRELRALVVHRQRLISQRSAAKNRLHSLLHRHNICPPTGNLFSAECQEWWEGLPISSSERLRAQQEFAIIGHLCSLVKEVEEELAQLSVSEPWTQHMTYVMQIPGIGLLTAMTILGAIGEISRFPTAKKLVGYAGLGARIHASGQMHRTGGITKQGRRELRAAMIEAAWAAVRYHPYWKGRFCDLAKRIGKLKAIVAMARKLLVVVWHVLTRQVADRHADVPAVARKLTTWALHYKASARQNLPTANFVRQQLDQLGIGMDLDSFRYGRRVISLPPSQVFTAPTGAE